MKEKIEKVETTEKTGKTLSLRERMIKNSRIEGTDILTQSKIYNKRDLIRTSVPIINVALSGTVDGGMTSGILQIAGPSKHFKTGFALLLARSFIDKYPDGTILFYDNEFGASRSYFESYNIPMEQVIHCPIINVEDLIGDISSQLKALSRDDDHVMIIIDSIGNIASRKEITDALSNDVKVDPGLRAKSLKALGRQIYPALIAKDVPLVAINHTYKEVGTLYPKDVVSGGNGLYYNSDYIWIIGRQQEKNKEKEISGYNFDIKIDKSRYIKEKSKLSVSISFDKGIHRWSGLFDLALESKFIVPEGIKFFTVDEDGVVSDKKFSRAELENNDDYWTGMLKNKKFTTFIEETYSMKNEMLIDDDATDDNATDD